MWLRRIAERLFNTWGSITHTHALRYGRHLNVSGTGPNGDPYSSEALVRHPMSSEIALDTYIWATELSPH